MYVLGCRTGKAKASDEVIAINPPGHAPLDARQGKENVRQVACGRPDARTTRAMPKVVPIVFMPFILFPLFAHPALRGGPQVAQVGAGRLLDQDERFFPHEQDSVGLAGDQLVMFGL